MSDAQPLRKDTNRDMETARWFFDELTHAGDEHVDPEYVAAYDRRPAPTPRTT